MKSLSQIQTCYTARDEGTLNVLVTLSLILFKKATVKAFQSLEIC